MAEVKNTHTPFPYLAMDNAYAANIAFDEMRHAEDEYQITCQSGEGFEKREALEDLHEFQDKFEWYMNLTSIWLERAGYKPQVLKR